MHLDMITEGLYVIMVDTHRHTELVNITAHIRNIIEKSELENGTCNLYVPHTTAALMLTRKDDDFANMMCLKAVNVIARTGTELTGEDEVESYVKASLVGYTMTIPVVDGEPFLGRDQKICLADFNGGQERRVIIDVTSALSEHGRKKKRSAMKK